MPSPQTPLPERARGFENLQLFLAPLLLLWEKGLGDEGKRFVSQSETVHFLRKNVRKDPLITVKKNVKENRFMAEIRSRCGIKTEHHSLRKFSIL
jgi:hypothetical protein